MNDTKLFFHSLILGLTMAAPGCAFDVELEGTTDVGVDDDDDDAGSDGGVGEAGDEAQDESHGSEEGEGGEGEGGATASYDRVDILMVIDGSMSMTTEQVKLSLALPEFFSQLVEVMPEVSFRVGVVGSDGSVLNDLGLDLLPCSGQAFSEFTGELSTELLLELMCRSQVGLEANIAEKPMESMLSALAQAQGGVNGDFLRDDALLSVIVVTDEDDHAEGGSQGEPLDWAEELTALAGGDIDALATFMLMGQPEPNACLPIDPSLLDPNADLTVEAEPAIRLGAFAELLPGFEEDVCLPTYASFFAEVTSALSARTR